MGCLIVSLLFDNVTFYVCVQMLSSGIPELSDVDDLKYVYDALRPHESEADATMHFTRWELRDFVPFSLDFCLFKETIESCLWCQ